MTCRGNNERITEAANEKNQKIFNRENPPKQQAASSEK